MERRVKSSKFEAYLSEVMWSMHALPQNCMFVQCIIINFMESNKIRLLDSK